VSDEVGRVGVTYCDTVLARGRMTIEQFAPQTSFFFYTHGDFFEEIAQVPGGTPALGDDCPGAVRGDLGQGVDVPFRLCRGRRFAVCPPAQNNIVRVAYEAMASVLSGVQSMFTAAWDEPFALPSEESATLALRTQQILAYETGVARGGPQMRKRSPHPSAHH
jgi:methylmalonyl-CoA mutase, N-terminal domain